MLQNHIIMLPIHGHYAPIMPTFDLVMWSTT